MAKYLKLKHYRGGPARAVALPPMDRWTLDEIDAQVQFTRDLRYGGRRRPPMTDGPFVETKDLIAR
ncbi:hypothetical protein [Kribbella monticola]|uniref:hypothetical protein n=1 Tax=Kribbella monticola TaxID=2185285 RepID=UPI0018E55B22|nr:hypothetical protein [Kribbella monticola]